MSRTFLTTVLLIVNALGSSAAISAAPTSPPQGHIAWVAQVLEHMQAIKPGMTRKELLKVFTVTGGMFTAKHRRFVSRECPYFKVDVEFEIVGGHAPLVEGDQDRIIKISTPYLQFDTLD